MPFNQQAIQSKVRTSNQVVILIGTQPIGFGQSSNFGVEYGTEALYGIGSANPQDNPQLRTGITVSLEVFQLTDAGLAYLGQPSDLADVLTGNQFNIGAIDNTGKVLKTAVSCVASNCNISLPVNQPITESLSFIGLDVLGPDGTSILVSSNALTLASTAAGALSSLLTPTATA